MANLPRKRHLSRRAVLRGAGATVALPLLSAMTPALSRRPAPSPVRSCFIFAPNGMKMDDWTPQGTGTSFQTQAARWAKPASGWRLMIMST